VSAERREKIEDAEQCQVIAWLEYGGRSFQVRIPPLEDEERWMKRSENT
jgi:hypothetical protein